MKNNKGFTLIELIVVIAIIAVLAVVLAPQYIQYVERGRESNDIQTAQNLMDAASVAAADPTLSNPAETYTITFDATAGTYSVLPAGDAFETAINNIVETSVGAAQSVEGKSENLVIVVNTQTGSTTASGSTADNADNGGWEALLD